MEVQLGALTVALDGDAGPLREAWEQLFAGWQSAGTPDLTLSLRVASALPPVPGNTSVFADPRGIVDVYAEGSRYLLHFHSGALVRLGDDKAEGTITPAAIENGHLEDVTYTALAPLLRGRGYYLLHAFAAARDARAILLCGASGSGKTTTGANLLLHGWKLLANDVVMLHERDGAVYALPTPGPLRVRPPTLFLLPELRYRRGQPHAPTSSYVFAGDAVGDGWANAAPVSALFFAQIEAGATQSRLHSLPRAIALAHLLEESVDRWDKAEMAGHLALLQRLAGQAAIYRLHLGRDVENLPYLLRPEEKEEPS